MNTIVTYTVIRSAPTGFEGEPYCVAIIDTGNGRVTSRVAGYVDGMEVAIGEELIALDDAGEYGERYAFPESA